MTKLFQFLSLVQCLTLVLANNGNKNGNKNNNNGKQGGKDDGAQSSLTLLDDLVQSNSDKTGFNASNLAQTKSATSPNNFINFCEGKTLTNGEQVQDGSCNGIPMGDIPNVDDIPAAKFQFPKNLGTIPANEDFTIKLKTSGFETGKFTNANTNYYSAPQQLNDQGQIIGHCHVVVSPLKSLTSTDLGTPLGFTFFKGIDDPSVNGVSTADVTGGVPAGAYRLCSINTSANHVPLLVAVAQHDSMDDCVYFTASDNGGNKNNGGKGKQRNAGAKNSASKSSTGSGSNSEDNQNGGTSGSANAKQQRNGGRKSNRRRSVRSLQVDHQRETFIEWRFSLFDHINDDENTPVCMYCSIPT